MSGGIERGIIMEDCGHKYYQENSDYLQVLLLCYFDNLSVKDIARITSKKPCQISDIFYNAKKTLQSIIIKGEIKYEILRPDAK